MHDNDCNNINLSVNAREDGTLEAAYIQLVADATVVRTEEVVKSVLLVDYNGENDIVGIEILAPVKISRVLELASKMEAAHRESFDTFVKRYAPPSVLEPA